MAQTDVISDMSFNIRKVRSGLAKLERTVNEVREIRADCEHRLGRLENTLESMRWVHNHQEVRGQPPRVVNDE